MGEEAGRPLRASRRGLARTVLLPLVVIAAIAAVIWWLEYRPEAGRGTATGERYGPVDLPAALVSAGMAVSPKEGSLAPDFILETLTGDDLRLSDLRGRAVVLNFWATWCAPCRREIPQLVAAYEQNRDEGLLVVGMNLQESESIIRPYAEDFGMRFPIAIDRDGEVADEYRLLGVPTTYFIDREGVVRSVFRGPLLEKVREGAVQGAIEEGELGKRIEEVLE